MSYLIDPAKVTFRQSGLSAPEKLRLLDAFEEYHSEVLKSDFWNNPVEIIYGGHVASLPVYRDVAKGLRPEDASLKEASINLAILSEIIERQSDHKRIRDSTLNSNPRINHVAGSIVEVGLLAQYMSASASGYTPPYTYARLSSEEEDMNGGCDLIYRDGSRSAHLRPTQGIQVKMKTIDRTNPYPTITLDTFGYTTSLDGALDMLRDVASLDGRITEGIYRLGQESVRRQVKLHNRMTSPKIQ